MATRKAGTAAQLLLAGLVGIGSVPSLLLSAVVIDEAVAQDVDTNKETPTPSPKPAPGGALLLPGEGAQPEPPKAILEHEPLAPPRAPSGPLTDDGSLPLPQLEIERLEHGKPQGEAVVPPQAPVPPEPLGPRSPGE